MGESSSPVLAPTRQEGGEGRKNDSRKGIVDNYQFKSSMFCKSTGFLRKKSSIFQDLADQNTKFEAFTSHWWESYSGIEDYELKASIT
jgi:hypothetical protein